MRKDGRISTRFADDKEPRVARDLFTENMRSTLVEVATFVSAMLTIAGEKEIARRVRPSTRQPGQTDEVAASDGVANLSPSPAPATTTAPAPSPTTPARNG